MNESTAYLEYKYELDLFNLNSIETNRVNIDELINKFTNYDSNLIIEEKYANDFELFISLLKTNYVLLSMISIFGIYLLIASYVLVLKPLFLMFHYLHILMLKNEYKKLYLNELNEQLSIDSIDSDTLKEFKDPANVYGFFCAYLKLEQKCAFVPNRKMFLEWYKLNKSIDELVKEKKRHKKFIYSY